MPFHLVATDRQRTPKEDSIAYLRSKGLAENSPNFTVTSNGGHPAVKGNGYVPYYMVFDHRGRLIREHMCGDYHGGDGLEMIEWVEKALKDAPAIYIGEGPYDQVPDLAKQISAKKDLGEAVEGIKVALDSGADGPAREQLEKLQKVLDDYRDAQLKRADDLLATTPSAVVPRLKTLADEFKGSVVGDEIAARAKELKSSRDLKDAISVEKTLAKTMAGLDKLKPCKPCKRKGMKTARSSCPTCKQQNAGAYKSAVKKLTALTEKYPDLPITKTVKEKLAGLK
jgi:hypothetical protein